MDPVSSIHPCIVIKVLNLMLSRHSLVSTQTRNQRGTASTMAFATQVLTYVTFPSLHGPGMDTLTRQSYRIGILNVQAPP